ncbi:MAG: zf-HC2 domain-containing protein [Abditibacteriales bacterium]|nr:zf-HC2 domain-containing protein [Abditibacteriales bacterium]MDW8367979.1 zf-HC2 domain-containing protein [Abditibacteriales bacterium]
MNCRQVCERLERYLSGETNRAEAQAVEAHLATCPSCQVERDTLRMVRAALDNYPRIKASPDFDFRVLEVVLARTAKSDSLLDRLDALFARPLYKLLGASALGVVIALLTTALVALPHARSPEAPAPPDAIAVQPWTWSHGLYAFDLDWFDDEDTAGTRPDLRSDKRPDRRRKSSWDANTSELSSSRQSGSWC